MKNIVILENEEVAHIFSDEGFKLYLADGQTITIKAEGAKMSNGELTVFAAHVRGDAETVQAVLREFSKFLSVRNGTGDQPVAARAPAAAATLPLADPTPVKLLYKKRATGRSPLLRETKASGKTVCDHCQRKFTTWQGRARHQGSCEQNPANAGGKKKDQARVTVA